jgi:hypothetical protein
MHGCAPVRSSRSQPESTILRQAKAALFLHDDDVVEE